MQEKHKYNATCELARSVLLLYPVKRAALFGSYAREEASEKSDIDMLVEFLPDTPGIDFFGLKVDLEDVLSRSVDLLTYRSLHKTPIDFQRTVEKEARIIYEQS